MAVHTKLQPAAASQLLENAVPASINAHLLLPIPYILTEKESNTRAPDGKDIAGNAKVQYIVFSL